MPTKAPILPDPPATYDPEYHRRLLGILRQYFKTLDDNDEIHGVYINFSYFDTNRTLVRGLVKSSTLDGAVLAAANTITLVSTENFSASGNAYILDGNISDKIQYTGKTSTTLTGVTGVANGHSSGKLVVASARTGDVFADPLNEYTLKIIP